MAKIKSFKGIVKELCKREGLKKQVDVAQVTELLSHFSDIYVESKQPWFISLIIAKNGQRRWKQKQKKK